GVSLMLLVEKMDEGPILAQADYDIEAEETAPSLTDNLIHLSYSMLYKVLPAYVEGSIQPVSQEVIASELPKPLRVSYSRKLSKEDSNLDWNKSAEELEREVRA